MKHKVVGTLWVLCSLIPAIADAQRLRVDNGPSWFQADFDGSTITCVDNVSNGSDTIRRVSRAAVNDVDFARSTIKVGDYGVPYIEFWCKDERACWRRSREIPSVEELTPSVEVDASCRSVQECQEFLNRLRDAAASIYTPERPSRPTSRAPAPPEVVIDGSNIPSRIDFPGSSSPKVAPAPAPPAPRPQPSPAPRIPLVELLPPASSIGGAPTSPSDNVLLPRPPPATPSEAPSGLDADPFAPIPLTFRDIFRNFVDSTRQIASDVRKGARNLVQQYSGGIGPFLLDKWAGDKLDEGSTYLLKEYLKLQVFEYAKGVAESVAVENLFGVSTSDLPEAFQRDKALWAASIQKTADRSPSSALDEVRAINGLVEHAGLEVLR
jgi:hypothetical protein